MTCFAYRLTCVAMAVALSCSPVLSVCMALCLESPVAAKVMGDAQADHDRGTMAAPSAASAASPHAHHGGAAPQDTASVANTSPRAPSDARMVGTCDNCCVAGPVAFAAGPGVERTDGKAFASAPIAAVRLLLVSAYTFAAAPPGPPVPPPSPTRAPLALRI